MRLFIAIKLPEEIHSELKREQSKIYRRHAVMSMTYDFHITMKFLGEVENSKVPDIKKRLSEIKFKPFKAKLTDTGHFPDNRNIRVIWTGLNKHEEFKNLHKLIEKALPEFEKDKKFHPHITLARIKKLKHKKELMENIKRIKVEQKSFIVDKLHLIKSILSHEGSIYTDA